MIKALVIDDEPHSRELLATMLSDYCEGVQVVGTAEDVPAGIAAIQAETPDMVFLDIEMPGGDGLAVLEAFPNPEFQVIFVTGYSPQFLRQLDLAALAHIQKPVDLVELRATIQQSGLLPPTDPMQLSHLGSEDAEEHPTLILPSGKGYERIAVDEILYLEAHRAYAVFHLQDGGERLASHPLSHYEKLLPEELFFRIHKSFLVNCAEVKGYENGRGGNVFLKNGIEIPIAVRRKPGFIQFMRNLAPPR